MDDNITLNSIVFKRTVSKDPLSAVRRSSTRGINLPDVLTIKVQDTVNSTTKQPETRFQLFRVDRTEADTEGKPVTGSIYMVAVVPSNLPETALTSMLATARAAASASGFLEAGLNRES